MATTSWRSVLGGLQHGWGNCGFMSSTVSRGVDNLWLWTTMTTKYYLVVGVSRMMMWTTSWLWNGIKAGL